MNANFIKAIKLSGLLSVLPLAPSIAQTSVTLDSLKQVAVNEQKRILLYFSGSDWCGPCIKFQKNYVTQPEFQEFAKQHLIVWNADFPRKKANQLSKKKTAENEELAERYNPTGMFPYIVLLGTRGNVIRSWNSLPKETLPQFITQLSH